MNPKFKVELLEEVNEFLNGLNEKAREKIIYNMLKAQVVSDNELFKKLNNNVWEFRTLHNKTKYRLLPFGTRQIKPKLSLYQLTELKRKQQRHLKRKLKKPNG